MPWTHYFDFRLHPPRIVIARGGGLRRVLCSAFSKAPWPPLCERPLHLVSNLQRNVYDGTYPSEEAVKLTMYQDIATCAKARWPTADALSDAREYRRLTRAQSKALEQRRVACAAIMA